MSKKASEGIGCLVLDVKYGKAAFMKTKEEARQLASTMIKLGLALEKPIKTSAALSNMDVPIGYMVGNALEVAEAIQCLQGKKVDGLYELTTNLGGELLRIQNGISLENGRKQIVKAIQDGRALRKFQDMLEAQGVKRECAEKLCIPGENIWNILPKSKMVFPVSSKQTGYVHHIDASIIGKISHELGAGRTQVGQAINYGVGLELLVHLGSYVKEGDHWIKIHCDEKPLERHLISLHESICLKPEKFEKCDRITEFISYDTI